MRLIEIAIVALVATLSVAVEAAAQAAPPPTQPEAATAPVAQPTPPPATDDVVLDTEGRTVTAPPMEWGRPEARRPRLLPVLYASFVALEVYDGYSTNKGVGGGATESNPVLRGAAGNQGLIWAVKGGAAIGSIYLAERLWKKRHRGSATAVMVAANAVMALVAVRNRSVLITTR